MGDANTEQGNTGQGQDLQSKATEVQQNIRDMGNQVRDVAQDKFNELRDSASAYYEQGRQRAQEWEQGLEDYVQQQPVKALLIAAGVGALIGFLWRR
jgi:ElaB/YqjD/DUF883 family membrane-anchored ribosome-binding protein